MCITDESDRDQLVRKTEKAAPKWKEIGRALGFRERELDCIPYRTTSHASPHVEYYSELLSQWLDWAPPEPHYFPTLDRMVSALRVVGKERLAYDLERNGLHCL